MLKSVISGKVRPHISDGVSPKAASKETLIDTNSTIEPTSAHGRVQLRRTARREAILKVARGYFLSEGFAATSMSVISSRLGGSKGTLYNYFENKEDLFAAVMRRECASRVLPLFDQAAASTVEETLYRLGRGFLEFVLSDATLTIQRVIIAEGARFPELGRIFYENGPKLFTERLVELFADLIEAGSLPSADPVLAASHFKDLALSSTDHMVLWRVHPPLDATELDRQARIAVAAFLKAYG
jgi:AcrR family transcriptional regulator